MHFVNVRVYGVLVNENKEVLVTDEWIRGGYFTKFPGGGLEYGEGTRDCLKREFIEEMNLRVEVRDHLYTTDFFQENAFRPGNQILSIYYWVQPLEDIRVRFNTRPFEFDEAQIAVYETTKETESFRWISLDQISEADVSLPIDKIVVNKIKAHFNPQ